MSDPSTEEPVREDDETSALPGTRTSDYFGMGTLVGLGAALGLLFGTMMGNLTWGLIIGAAAGTVIGAIVEAQKRR
jgi:hypothetical protein